MKIVQTILVGKPKMKEANGRPWHKWEHDTQIDNTEHKL
jgi:hypothetical protein